MKISFKNSSSLSATSLLMQLVLQRKVNCLFVFISLLSFSACNTQEQCRKNTYVNVGVGFYKISTSILTKKDSVSTLVIDSITIRGINEDNSLVDSILYNNRKRVSKIILPLNKFSAESRFLIRFNQTTDTLIVRHTNTDEYLSLECGCIKTHQIDTLISTKNYINTLYLKYKSVNTTNAEHIQIYRFFK